MSDIANVATYAMFANSRVQAQRPGDSVLLHGPVAVWAAALGGQAAGPAVRQRRQDPVCETRSLGAPVSHTLPFIQFTQIDVY